MTAQMNHILVTGGAGFIGSHLVDALVAQGRRVRVLDALVRQVHAGRGPQFLPEGVEFIHGDVRDSVVIDQALQDIDAVYHLAAEVGVAQSMYEMKRYVAANSLGTATLLTALSERRSNIRKLVVASSMSVYGEGAGSCERCGLVFPDVRPTAQLMARDWDVRCPTCSTPVSPAGTPESGPLCPTSVYAVTKQDQEQLALIAGRAYEIPTIALRFFTTYGTRQALSNPYTGSAAIFSARLMNDQPPLIFEDGHQSRDFVHVSDIVQALLLALESDRASFHAINIGTGANTTVLQLAALLARGLGKSIEPEVVGRYREGDIRHCGADISQARELLGYEPRTSLQHGIGELLEWVRGEEAADGLEGAQSELESRRLIR